MELVQVNRLYLEKESKECVVVLQGCKSGAKTRLVLPEREAAVIALEAHGVNDRCSLYHVLTTCVTHLGGAFCNVTIKLNARSEAASYLTILQGEDHKSLNVNVGEVIALALHGGLPIYLDTSDYEGGPEHSTPGEAAMPHAFESLLSDLVGTDHDEKP